MGKQKIVITPGDPVGIGPEITLKSLVKQKLLELASICVVCHSEVLAKAAETIGCSVSFNVVKTPDEMTRGHSIINVIELFCLRWNRIFYSCKITLMKWYSRTS